MIKAGAEKHNQKSTHLNHLAPSSAILGPLHLTSLLKCAIFTLLEMMNNQRITVNYLTSREIRHQEIKPMWDAVIDAYAGRRMSIEESKQCLDSLVHYVDWGFIHGKEGQKVRTAYPPASQEPLEPLDEWDNLLKPLALDEIENPNADSEGKRELEE